MEVTLNTQTLKIDEAATYIYGKRSKYLKFDFAMMNLDVCTCRKFCLTISC